MNDSILNFKLLSDSVYETIQRFIDDALSEGVPVAILAAYGRNGEKISRYSLYKINNYCPLFLSLKLIDGNIVTCQNILCFHFFSI